jgi:hypothetical protein
LANDEAEILLGLLLSLGRKDYFVMLLITDLPYFENTAENKLISGSAGTIVIADATSSGISTNTIVFTNSTSRVLPNSGSLSIGLGFAVAIGNDPNAGVTVGGFGDIVVGATFSTPNKSSKPIDVAGGVVVAIGLPSH